MQQATVGVRSAGHTARRLITTITGSLALIGVLAAPAAAAAAPDRWSPPVPRHGADFVTTDIAWSDGATSTAVLPESLLPLRMVVEREVADVLGVDRVRAGITAWNAIPGSRFSAVLDGTVATGARKEAADGVNRIYLDDSCGGEELAWARLTRIDGARHYGMAAGFTADADIGVCRRLLADPGAAPDTLRHEVAHLLGLGHVDGDCRVLSARQGTCEQVTEQDRDAVRYLYPTLPRLAGPSRIETAARTSFATRPQDRRATTVVLADGFASSTLPVTAAALAGTLDAPLLLVGDGGCLTGATGWELGRVASPDATVALVGARAVACAGALQQRGWTTVTLTTPGQVAAELIRRAGSDTVFVVRGPHADGNLPDGLTAAAAAGHLNAPVLTTAGARLDDQTRAVLDAHPTVRRAVIVGGDQAVPAAVVAELRDRGLTVQRHAGTDRLGTALAVAAMPGVFDQRVPVLVASADKWADTVSGSALGAARGWPVVLTGSGSLDDRVARFLAERATGGYVMGGGAAISDTAHLAAARHIP